MMMVILRISVYYYMKHITCHHIWRWPHQWSTFDR